MKNAQALLSMAGLLAAFSVAPREAHASKEYPALVQSYWNLKRPYKVAGTKGCMLCHKDDAGNKGTVVQPFGVTVHQRFGAQGANQGSLVRALGQVQSQRSNSDKDPVDDYTEIVVDGTNPNDPHDYVEPVVTQPVEPPPEGGQGGEGGAAGASGTGGVSGEIGTSVIEGPLPPAPPPLEDLPPPYTHGCALGAQSSKSSTAEPALIALLGLGVLSARAARRRRRTR